MKTSEIKNFLKIYLKRVNKLQEREIKLLWKAIKAKVKKDREAKEATAKPKKIKKLEYDTDDENDDE